MTVDVSPLMAGNCSVSDVFLGAEVATDRAHNMIQHLIDEAGRGEFKVVIDVSLSGFSSWNEHPRIGLRHRDSSH